jgi:hypothetical protein
MSRIGDGEPGDPTPIKLCRKCGQAPRDGRGSQRWCRICRTQDQKDRRASRRRSTAALEEQERARSVSIIIQSLTYPLRILAGYATLLECQRGEPLTLRSRVPATMAALRDLARANPEWVRELPP